MTTINKKIPREMQKHELLRVGDLTRFSHTERKMYTQTTPERIQNVPRIVSCVYDDTAHTTHVRSTTSLKRNIIDLLLL